MCQKLNPQRRNKTTEKNDSKLLTELQSLKTSLIYIYILYQTRRCAPGHHKYNMYKVQIVITNLPECSILFKNKTNLLTYLPLIIK